MPLGNFLSGHRMPSLPKPPPSRPAASLPPDYDAVNIQMFGSEFDAVPLPNQAEAQARALNCSRDNMNFIRSMIPVSIQHSYAAFFTTMAQRQWRPARVNTATPQGRPAFGTHRPAGAPDNSRPLYGKHATDWDKIRDLDRVNAYVFRGDKRRVSDIRAAGGFQPPSTRTDEPYMKLIGTRFAKYMKERFNRDVDADEVYQYIRGQGKQGRDFTEYQIWRSILEGEKFHIERMVTDEFLRGFISTSRDVRVAQGFCLQTSADGQRAPTFAVYALHTEDGFLLPPRAQHVHGSNGEAEVAHPGLLPWKNVMGFRTFIDVNFDDPRTFRKSGVIFMRKGFQAADPKGYQEVFYSLGKL